MHYMPIAGVATAGISVAAAAGEYVTAASVVVHGLGNACCNDVIYLVTPRSLKRDDIDSSFCCWSAAVCSLRDLTSDCSA